MWEELQGTLIQAYPRLKGTANPAFIKVADAASLLQRMEKIQHFVDNMANSKGTGWNKPKPLAQFSTTVLGWVNTCKKIVSGAVG